MSQLKRLTLSASTQLTPVPPYVFLKMLHKVMARYADCVVFELINNKKTASVPLHCPTSGTFFRGDLVMKKISTAILSLPLIQEEQLSVTGESTCKLPWRLVQEQCG